MFTSRISAWTNKHYYEQDIDSFAVFYLAANRNDFELLASVKIIRINLQDQQRRLRIVSWWRGRSKFSCLRREHWRKLQTHYYAKKVQENDYFQDTDTDGLNMYNLLKATETTFRVVMLPLVSWVDFIWR